MHELRNFLNTATLAFHALEAGNLPIGGSTGAVLKRSLTALTKLVSQSLEDVRVAAGTPAQTEVFSLASFIAEATLAASLYASASGCELEVSPVDAQLEIAGNRVLLLAALANLLQNAFKFTHAHTAVTLSAYADGDRVLIDVEDNCGGLPPGTIEKLFKPFSQAGGNRSGLGLGLSIARRSVEADGGVLSVQDVPGSGCVFTISLPRQDIR